MMRLSWTHESIIKRREVVDVILTATGLTAVESGIKIKHDALESLTIYTGNCIVM